METGTKVLIGVGIGIAVGVGIYFATRTTTEKIVPAGGDGKPSGGGDGKPDAPKTASVKEMTKAEKLLKQGKCNLQVPPPRFSADKKSEYDRCMHSANGTWTR